MANVHVREAQALGDAAVELPGELHQDAVVTGEHAPVQEVPEDLSS